MKTITTKISSIKLNGEKSHSGYVFENADVEPLYMATDEVFNFLIVFYNDKIYAIEQSQFEEGFLERVDTDLFLPLDEENHISIIKNRFGSISISKCDIICQQSYEAFYQGIGR